MFTFLRRFSVPATPPRPVQKVSYFYEPEIGNYYYGEGHPMKPHRVRMTHALLLNYGLYRWAVFIGPEYRAILRTLETSSFGKRRQMDVYRPHPATEEDMTRFHSDDYIQFLKQVTPENQHKYGGGVVQSGTHGSRANTCSRPPPAAAAAAGFSGRSASSMWARWETVRSSRGSMTTAAATPAGRSRSVAVRRLTRRGAHALPSADGPAVLGCRARSGSTRAWRTR